MDPHNTNAPDPYIVSFLPEDKGKAWVEVFDTYTERTEFPDISPPFEVGAKVEGLLSHLREHWSWPAHAKAVDEALEIYGHKPTR